jgi:hypothetical protein
MSSEDSYMIGTDLMVYHDDDDDDGGLLNDYNYLFIGG